LRHFRIVSRGEARQVTLAETLYRVAQAVAERDDLHEIVQVVTDEATTITGAQFGAFFYNVVDRDGESYSLYTISGVPRERFERFPMPRNTDIFRPTFEGTATLRIDDVTADPRYGRNPPYHGMPAGHLPVRSYLAVSVFNRAGEVVGGLFFGHEQTDVFTREHERIVEAIAANAGVAIEKAQLLAAERAARAEAEARADAAVALEVVDDGVALVDEQGILRLWNRAAETITGLRAAAVLGRPVGHAIPGWERIALQIPVTDQSVTATPATLPLDTLSGREVWLSLYGIAFGAGTVYAFRDVTDQRELESLRSDTIATVSHELRTPIAAVYGAAQTLRRRAVDPATSERLLEVIDAESTRLAALVEEILLASQIDAGRITVARTAIDPAQAVDAVARRYDASRVAVDVDAAGTATAAGDPEKLRQVLANLLENALKYGRDPVRLRVSAVRSAVRFDISDSGDGIPTHEQQRIFEKFYRGEAHFNGSARGTGLGLYICRELVRRMNGRIGVDSTHGRGATFWVELPRYD
jgi:PAS domain S-box-containing protein